MELNTENIRSQMRKGVLEYCILSILDKKEAYASAIIEELKGANMIVVEGTLYPMLIRLKNQGALTYRWEESTSGPPRKYFCLTDEGRQLLAQLRDEWRAISSSIQQITQQ